MELALEIAGIAFGGGSLITLIIFLITRKDTKESEYTEIKNILAEMDKKFLTLEKDIVRTQLIQLMQGYEEGDDYELMQVAEYYFSKEHLAANWYMTTMFKRFIKQHNIETPIWFKE